MKRKKPLWIDSEWSWDLLHKVYEECEKIATKELQLNCYPNQLEIIDSTQMLDAYTSIGMPIYYQHWSFGKHFITEQKRYQKGHNGLAFEIVINSNPTINYLMEDNTMTTQALVIAHAAFGHNHFFKNNYLFKQWTDAASIVDYLIFARDYVSAQETKHGRKAVEEWLDSCHALMDHGVNRYKRPSKLSMEKEKQRQKDRADYLQTQVSEFYRILPSNKHAGSDRKKFPAQPEENLLYFFEKYSPNIEDWQRELLRIVRKVAQYFYPQGQCVTGNHLVSTPKGILRFDELIKDDGYIPVSGTMMLTDGNMMTPVSHTYKRKAKVMRITTGTGRTFTGTPEHPLMILRNHSHIMCPISQITKEDYIVTNLNYDIFATTEPPLTYTLSQDILTCQVCGMQSYFIASHVGQMHGLTAKNYTDHYNLPVSTETSRIKKSSNKINKYPSVMNPTFAEFCALMQGANYNLSYNNVIIFSNNNKNLVDRFSNCLNELFGLVISPKIDKFGRYAINFSSYTLVKFMKENVPELFRSTRIIPKIIRSSTKESVKSWLRSTVDLLSKRRFDLGSWTIPIRDYDKEYLEQIQTILYGFGIVAETISSENQTYAGIAEKLGLPLDDSEVSMIPYMNLRIISDHRDLYTDIIGTTIPTIPPATRTIGVKHNIPNALTLLKYVRAKLVSQREEFALLHRDSGSLSYKQKIERNLLIKQNFVASTEIPEIIAADFRYDKIQSNSEKIDNLKKITTIPEAHVLYNLLQNAKDKFYDPIMEIENLEDEQYVYDVTVPYNHLFWLDGVISHNTKIMNEGFASLTHYDILNKLHDKGLTTDGAHLEFLALHSNVLYQPSYDSKYYNGINPYAFGFAMLRDIQRMCAVPTEEDIRWFPQIKSASSQELILDAVANYRDESFIRQWLSPNVIRKQKLFGVYDNRADPNKYYVSAIHNENGYQEIREKLADQYLRAAQVPHIEVVEVDTKTRTLILRYSEHRGRQLGNINKMLPHIERLWGGYPVFIKDENGSLLGNS
jgi:spore cortex formation protein SpoVR/YcgB (stage V sporulation)